MSLPVCDVRQHPRAGTAFCVSIQWHQGGCHLLTSGSRYQYPGRVCRHGCAGTHPPVSEPVVSLITWRPRCSGEAAVRRRGRAAVEELLEFFDGVNLALFDGASDRRVAAAGCACVLAARALLPRRHCRRLRTLLCSGRSSFVFSVVASRVIDVLCCSFHRAVFLSLQWI